MKFARFLFSALALSLVVCFAVACESEKSGTGDDILDVSPSYAKLKQGQRVTLTASRGSDYVWSLSDESIGSLSSRHGRSVVYTAQACGNEDATQTITVNSKLTGGITTTNGVNLATGTATILHRGTGE